MDLIANVAAAIIAFCASVLGSIMAHDICVSAERTCAKIIRKAASRLAPFDREAGESEWLADPHDRETVHEKYQHAIGCFLVAGKMRRQARAVTIAISFQVTGVGTIPLALNMSSWVLGPLFFKAMNAKSDTIKKIVVIFGALYLLAKFIRSANRSLGPGLKLTREHLKQYKTWGYGARIKRKGIDLNVGNIFRAMVLQPDRIQEIIKKVSDCLTPLNEPRPT